MPETTGIWDSQLSTHEILDAGRSFTTGSSLRPQRAANDRPITPVTFAPARRSAILGRAMDHPPRTVGSFDEARAEIRKMERAVLEQRIEELHAQRAAISDEELEEWLEDRTVMDLVMLGGDLDDADYQPAKTSSNNRLTFSEEK